LWAGIPPHPSNAENFAGLYLCEAATLDDTVDLQREMGLELLAFGIGKTNIGKHVAAALFEGHASLFLVAIANCSFAD
jgi:hypothetical protein